MLRHPFGVPIMQLKINTERRIKMPNCGSCGRLIPADEMKKSMSSDISGLIMPDVDWKKMPNVMENLAMKCNRCGEWICSKCASKTALNAGAGMIQHSNCGGMFETP